MGSMGSYPNPSKLFRYEWIMDLPGFRLSQTVPRINPQNF